jgi:hypothetical protein
MKVSPHGNEMTLMDAIERTACATRTPLSPTAQVVLWVTLSIDCARKRTVPLPQSRNKASSANSRAVPCLPAGSPLASGLLREAVDAELLAEEHDQNYHALEWAIGLGVRRNRRDSGP